MEQLYVKIIPTCWRRKFLYRCYNCDNLTCGEDLTSVDGAQLKEVIFSVSVVVSSYMEIYIFISKAKARTAVTFTVYLIVV